MSFTTGTREYEVKKSFRFKKAQWEKIETLAAMYHTTPSRIIRECVAEICKSDIILNTDVEEQ